jgi:hypothetical protein
VQRDQESVGNVVQKLKQFSHTQHFKGRNNAPVDQRMVGIKAIEILVIAKFRRGPTPEMLVIEAQSMMQGVDEDAQVDAVIGERHIFEISPYKARNVGQLVQHNPAQGGFERFDSIEKSSPTAVEIGRRVIQYSRSVPAPTPHTSTDETCAPSPNCCSIRWANTYSRSA